MEITPLTIPPKPPKGADGYKTFSVRIKSELVDKLDEIADSTRHSRNELIGIMLTYAIENYHK